MSRPAVPAAVKRRLRQEAGFGCCRCGFPVVQYQHVIPYSVDPHFRPEDMMCLCPNCHDMATKGALPEHEQRRLKEQPLNIECGLTAGKLAVTESPLALELGSVLVVNDGPIVAHDDVVVIAVTYDGASPLLSLDLRDERRAVDLPEGSRR